MLSGLLETCRFLSFEMRPSEGTPSPLALTLAVC